MSKVTPIAFLLALAVAFLSATGAQAAPPRPPGLIDAVKSVAGTGYTIPASWSGIWTTTDSTYNCTPHTLKDVSTYVDTLCAGQSFEPDTTDGFDYQCTGTVTDTEVHLTCSGSFTFEGCTGTFSTVTDGTRIGDTAISTSTYTVTWSPSFCAFQADLCEVSVTRTTRIAPQPGTCTTPTRQGTWGALKVKYR